MKYKYYYLDKIRETTKSGALFFGTAFDKATEAVLRDKNINEKAVFDKWWQNQDINGEEVALATCLDVVYAASDFDYDILHDEDLKFLAVKAHELVPELGEGTTDELQKTCAGFKKQRAFRRFKPEENAFLNLCNWVSLRRKGHLMLDANRLKVLPYIKKVLSLQEPIEMNNGEGDVLIGYPDLVCQWQGLDGVLEEAIVFDYKTSSIEYAEDAVLTSPQLTIYCHAKNIKRAGYLVFRKGIIKNKIKICTVCKFNGSGSRHAKCASIIEGKRCGGAYIETIKPEVDVQIIIDTIPTRTEDIVIENIESANLGIRNKIFVRNFNSCHNSFGPCPYINLCFKGSHHGLLDMKKDR